MYTIIQKKEKTWMCMIFKYVTPIEKCNPTVLMVGVHKKVVAYSTIHYKRKRKKTILTTHRAMLNS